MAATKISEKTASLPLSGGPPVAAFSFADKTIVVIFRIIRHAMFFFEKSVMGCWT